MGRKGAALKNGIYQNRAIFSGIQKLVIRNNSYIF
jgi:hypothetical protein